MPSHDASAMIAWPDSMQQPLIYTHHTTQSCPLLLGVRVAPSKRLELFIVLLTYRAPAVSKWQKAFNKLSTPEKCWFFESRPKHAGPVYHNNILDILKIHLCLSHIGQVLMLPGAVIPDKLRFESLNYTDSSRSGRYWEWGHLESTKLAWPKQHLLRCCHSH